MAMHICMMMMMMMMMMIVSFCVGWGTALKLDVNPLRVMLWYLRAYGYIKKKPNGHFFIGVPLWHITLDKDTLAL